MRRAQNQRIGMCEALEHRRVLHRKRRGDEPARHRRLAAWRADDRRAHRWPAGRRPQCPARPAAVRRAGRTAGRGPAAGTAPRRRWRKPDCPAGRGRGRRPSRPKTSGLPGRMAIFQKSSSRPRRFSPSMTRSWSPTLAPPVVTSMSMPATASATAPTASTRVAGDRQHAGLAAARPHQGRERMRVGADDAAGRDRLAGQRDLVARRQDGDARPAMHRQPGMVGGGGQSDIARAQAARGSDAPPRPPQSPARRGGCGGPAAPPRAP